MTDPISLPSATSRHGLPLLFSGQAHKEPTLNEALMRVDALLHPVVEAELATPPGQPEDGESWLVASAATGAWQGRDGQIATYAGSSWHYLEPSEGMRVFDKNVAVFRKFDAGWQQPAAISDPSGGTSVDIEARVAIGEICQLLREAGLLA